ncbi:MAG: hypothetical protein C0592_00965 [Marinilabiliales bacterium]|nr:MAG: hypothetical protein C0592_00965 [Marinilabiliales bacterium]
MKNVVSLKFLLPALVLVLMSFGFSSSQDSDQVSESFENGSFSSLVSYYVEVPISENHTKAKNEVITDGVFENVVFY